MKDEFRGKAIKNLLNQKEKLIHDSSEKEAFENYENCLEATQLENKIKHLEKNKINIDSLKKVMKSS